MALRGDIDGLVWSIPIADTHEHIMEEKLRLEPADGSRLDDFAVLFAQYADADLRVAGMTNEEHKRFFTRGVSVDEKWRILKPYYQLSRNTGYLRAARLSVQKLYGEDDITDESVKRIDEKVRAMIKPGFTRHIIKEVANIDHCQVHSLEVTPFCETQHRDFLLQDINIASLIGNWGSAQLHSLAEVEVRTLQDYHRAIDNIFEKFATSATAVKTNQAYGRGLDYVDVPADEIAPVFARDRAGEKLNPTQIKAIQDHLFNYCARKAAEYDLPLKMHTGYYSGLNKMPLNRLRHNAGDVCELLMRHPNTRFVVMHIIYPYQSELVSIAKQFDNAYADMCWAWVMNPVASVRFLKETLMAAPVNKVLTFGGDYRMPELVVGHAEIARQGIAQALAELVEEGWLPEGDLEFTANRIMRDNARELCRVGEKFGV